MGFDDLPQLREVAPFVERAAFFRHEPQVLRDHGTDRVAHVVPRHPELFKFAGDADDAFWFISSDLPFDHSVDV